jgi:hypothetical protein
MDIPKKLANQVTQDKGKQNKNTTQYVLDITIRKQLLNDLELYHGDHCIDRVSRRNNPLNRPAANDRQICNIEYIECTSPVAIIHTKHLREDKRL